jgi:Na+-driven multidrug efflux pump
MLLLAAIIGRLGTAPLGAVGLSTLIFVFSNLFFNFLTVCTTSTVAIAAADKNTAEVCYMFSVLTEGMLSRPNVSIMLCDTG